MDIRGSVMRWIDPVSPERVWQPLPGRLERWQLLSSSLTPGFEKPKPGAGVQLGGDKLLIRCFKCKNLGHVTANCPNK